ncbi:MAG: Ltp family lipoprotein [Candidatus Flemingibacterium sp.]|nr:Ltp family lipoprotein [Candidatus Flemingibacterium sp.]
MENQNSGKITIVIIGTILLLIIVFYNSGMTYGTQKDDSIIDDNTVITTSIEYLDGTETVQRSDGKDLTSTPNGSTKSSSTANVATMGELNALKKATEYLNVMHFSKKGLKEQLLFGKFTESEAEYAVTKLDIDWKLQAVGKAQDYLNSMSFSKQELKEQLEFEGFTSDEAKYAVDAVYK